MPKSEFSQASAVTKERLIENMIATRNRHAAEIAGLDRRADKGAINSSYDTSSAVGSRRGTGTFIGGAPDVSAMRAGLERRDQLAKKIERESQSKVTEARSKKIASAIIKEVDRRHHGDTRAKLDRAIQAEVPKWKQYLEYLTDVEAKKAQMAKQAKKQLSLRHKELEAEHLASG